MANEDECLFCSLIACSKSGKTEFLYKDRFVAAFRDINPKAPHHILIVPLKHISTVNDITDEDALLVGSMVNAARKVAVGLNLKSYRLVLNCGADAGQAVFHIHLHLLGGRSFGWPPG
ncbi:MAG: histidine triad nucleotide-binding protein [Elusimicrobia bacterium CG08_land_8_20_14_0_20_44_26]|nr:MAG: histidine triad nucleotide-binding protein [Elusimicrobia bacterium CG08_land_8_20_14_0_20_44_26]